MKAYTKDIIKTIVKGMKRFVALAIIAALGVCMMSGLKASCDDLRISADDFFDKQNLFDIMVVSTFVVFTVSGLVTKALQKKEDKDNG